MLIGEMMSPQGNVFLKSEWGPITSEWPVLSFGKPQVGKYLEQHFLAGRDVLIYVGTSNAAFTREREHQKRLLSAIIVRPEQMIDTSQAIPENVWIRSVAKFGAGRWKYSFAVSDAATISGPVFPKAREVIPTAYSTMGQGDNRGGIIQAFGQEREAVMGLGVTPVDLRHTPQITNFLKLAEVQAPSKSDLDAEIRRLIDLILQRVQVSGKPRSTLHPFRGAPSRAALAKLLKRKWTSCEEMCALCGTRMRLGSQNRMLQPSVDRIDSSNPDYNDGNTQLAHLACNWARNECSKSDYEEWLAELRKPLAEEVF